MQPKVDNLMWRLFKPVRDSLKAVQGATREGVPDKVTRAKLLRVELVKIGDHVTDLASDEGGDLDNSFWYVPCKATPIYTRLTIDLGILWLHIGQIPGLKGNKSRVCTTGYLYLLQQRVAQHPKQKRWDQLMVRGRTTDN